MIRTILAAAMVAVLALPHAAAGGEKPAATLYKTTGCGCCEGYAEQLRANGYQVTVKAMDDISPIKKQYGVPDELQGCHTTLVGGYVVEGHVPLTTLERLLTERPKIKGISLPGMPSGSPGMSGPKTEPFKVYELSEGTPKVYAVE